MITRAFPLLLIACGSAPPAPPANHAKPSVRPTLPEHYAALFREDGTWTYDVFVQFPTEKGPVKKNYKVGCRVVKVDTEKDRVASTIECEKPPAGAFREPSTIGVATLDGTWVAKPDGLFDGRNQLVIAAVPKPGTLGHHVFALEGTHWCRTEAPPEHPGPGGSDEMCFSKSGLVSHRRTFQPGSPDDHEEFSMQLR